MKITGNQVNPVSQVYLGKVKKAQAAEMEVVKPKDKVEISADAATIDVARGIIANMPEIRADKVEELRQKIQDGTYKVDPDDIAAKMLAEQRLSKLADE